MDFDNDLFFTNADHRKKKIHKAPYPKEKSHFEKPTLIF